jgi:hypothetical protein
LPADYAALLAGVLLFTASVFFVYGKNTGSITVAIKGEEATYLYPIDADSQVSVLGPLGETVVVVKDNGVSIASSPCKNQTCVAMGTIHGRGQWLACLPNAVLITVEGADGQEKAAADEPDAGTW